MQLTKRSFRLMAPALAVLTIGFGTTTRASASIINTGVPAGASMEEGKGDIPIIVGEPIIVKDPKPAPKK